MAGPRGEGRARSDAKPESVPRRVRWSGEVVPQAKRRGPLNRESGTEAGEVPCTVGEPDAITHGGAL